MTDEELAKTLSTFLPSYLSSTQKTALFGQLKKFPNNPAIYWDSGSTDPDVWQGDGWRGFAFHDFVTKKSRSGLGVMLSNTCDVSPGNSRVIAPWISFAPVIPLSGIIDAHRDAGKTAEQIADVVTSIKRQEYTSLFYLPERHNELPEAVVLLDQVSSHPAAVLTDGNPSRVFRLNQYGFYLFALKLSIHFCRFGEGAIRFA